MRMLVLAAALLCSAPLTAHAADTLRVCTAGTKGNYFAFAALMQRTLQGSIAVEPVATEGSWDNLARIKRGECDAAIVQSDADFVYRTSNAGGNLPLQRVGVLFTETANMVCNARLDITDLGDLITKKPKVAIGKVGSGSWVTWNGLVAADRINGSDEYTAIPTDTASGALALTQVVDGTEVGCMFWTMSANSDFIGQVQQVADSGKVLNFVALKDRHFNDTVDARGNSVYTPVQAQYVPDGFFSSGKLDTMAVQAVFYANTTWISTHEDAFNTLVNAFLPMVANFKAERKLN